MEAPDFLMPQQASGQEPQQAQHDALPFYDDSFDAHPSMLSLVQLIERAAELTAGADATAACLSLPQLAAYLSTSVYSNRVSGPPNACWLSDVGVCIHASDCSFLMSF